MEFRPYQQQAASSVVRYLKQGITRLLVSLPTGTGKTVVFAHLPQLLEQALGLHGKWLVLAHREELIDQALDKFRKIAPELFCEAEQASRRASPMARIVVASVQTLQRQRLEAIDPMEYAGVIVDECHHSTSPSYMRILEHMGCFSERRMPLIGFTATPKRGDDVGLGQVFQEIAFDASLREMVEAGYLAPITGLAVTSGVSLEGVRTSHGDFQTGELSQVVNTPERNRLVVATHKEHCQGRKALAFCADVDHALCLADAFNRNGIKAACVHGETPKDLRREILGEFHDGELDVVTNCGVLTEGYDNPRISAIHMTRPTKSNLLYMQMLGRGTRLFEGKENCLILDYVDLCARHSINTVSSLLGLPPEMDCAGQDVMALKAEMEQLELKYPWIDTSHILTISDLRMATKRIDFFHSQVPKPIEKFTRYLWRALADGSYQIMIPGREVVKIERSILGTNDIVLTDRLGKRSVIGTHPSLGVAVAMADIFINQRKPEASKLLNVKNSWRRDPASDKQKSYIAKLKLDVPEGLTKGQAAAMIDLTLQARG